MVKGPATLWLPGGGVMEGTMALPVYVGATSSARSLAVKAIRRVAT